MKTKELLESSEFAAALQANIDTYNNRPVPAKGQYYKRIPYDELKQRNMMNVEALRREYIHIMLKESKLSSSLRKAVNDIVYAALYTAWQKLQPKQENEAQAKRDAKSLANSVAGTTAAVVPKRKRKNKQV